MKTITIKNVPDDISDRFNALAQSENMTQLEFLTKLLNFYKPKKAKNEVSDVVAQVVNTMMEENESTGHWYEKRYLTPTVVVRAEGIISRITGNKSLNKAAVNQYFEAFKEEIDAHNREQGWTTVEEGERHNMKAGHARNRAAKLKDNEQGN